MIYLLNLQQLALIYNAIITKQLINWMMIFVFVQYLKIHITIIVEWMISFTCAYTRRRHSFELLLPQIGLLQLKLSMN